MSKVLVLIPSRMSAQRLPGKPLLEINKIPIISHVVNRGKEAKIGEVIVCTEDEEIVTAVEKNGGKAILTGKFHKNGTERIFEGLQKLKRNDVTHVLSLQGDEPAINPNDIKNLFNLMIKHGSDIGTLASEIKDDSIFNNENVVKVQTEEKLNNNNFIKALNFSRYNIYKKQNYIYYHIGIYCYNISILKKFVKFEQTKNEIKNRLEQLRAIENNIEIKVALARSSSIGVDTQEDYLALKKIMEYKS